MDEVARKPIFNIVKHLHLCASLTKTGIYVI